MLSWGCLLALSLAALTGTKVGAADVPSERNCSTSPPYLPNTVKNTTVQLQKLREQMVSLNISAYIIPNTDAHLSEYIGKPDTRVTFMTGFEGSAGTAVVTQKKAALWTDSRYWVQAEREMDCNWDLEKDVSISSIAQWLIAEVPDGKQIGFDPFLFSLDTQESYSINLQSSGRSLKSVSDNPVDKVWTDRPKIPEEALTILPDRVIERTWEMKVEQMRKIMDDNPYGPTALLLSALDENAWLFNMRGQDIPYHPFFYSYTLLAKDEIWLFIHPQRATEELRKYLNASCPGNPCVQIKDYDKVLEELKKYVARPDIKLWLGTEYTNYAVYEIIKPMDKIMTTSYSPALTTKAVKDETEQRILREAHVRDAVAVMQLLMYLEKAVPEGKESELSAADYANERRSEQKDSRGPSFATISASGPNAALAHYNPTNDTNRMLTVDEMFLIDSGGQYLDGTTDITRTVHWGTPTEMQREAFTRVLMGNIEISRTIFPSGTKGVNMEMLARRALWEVGLNYGHGTGHGVGNYFGVHEWPVGFQSNNIAFKSGMFTSIEPGYYKTNDFGIRIEDIAVTVPAKTKYGNNYLTFDTVSLVPYDRKLIDTSLLSPEQLDWLNAYYDTIRKVMGPELDRQGLENEKDWMLKNTQPFSASSGRVSSSSLILIALVFALLHNIM
ncbi:xaa-Pro aminopeptidase 2 [Nelusetta ayraudi]|uniref:xaa-Pro aminopeptidase 2 n=1 Tax=Nelusetta ayraudi TaxID=303726 RepID=UPI003F720D2B